MSEEIIINANTKEEKYKELLPQIKALLENENDLIANLANVCAALKYTFDFFWVGFYLDNQQGELVLGPFQGPIACTRIRYNRGVCGHSFSTQQTVIVADVEAFPGHIACSSDSKSEIVVPFFDSYGKIRGVLDVDSDQLNDFSETDQVYLEQIMGMFSEKI